jgi:hypothetical protein
MTVLISFGVLYVVAVSLGLWWAKKKSREFAAEQKRAYHQWLHQFDDPKTGD